MNIYIILKYISFYLDCIPCRQAPISNLSAFFSKEGLTVNYCLWEDTLSKSWDTHFPNLNNKSWRDFDVIALLKAVFQPEKDE